MDRATTSTPEAHVIPALIRNCVDARPAGVDRIVVCGTGNASREFLSMSTTLRRASCWPPSINDGPEPVNLGVGREITIRELVHLITRLAGSGGSIRWDSSKPDGQPRRAVDTRRAAQSCGFRAHTPLEEGPRRTIEWYEGVMRAIQPAQTP